MPFEIQSPKMDKHLTIQRPRLTERLSNALSNPLVILNAPSGYGKTVAISQYLSETDYTSVWFSFSSQDNLPVRFWAHLTTAFSHHRPQLAAAMRKHGFPETSQELDHFFLKLANQLYNDATTVVFIFDDLHLITNPVVLSFLFRLLSMRLEDSLFVLLTRQWPIQNQIPSIPFSVIDVADLCFTRDETRDYLSFMLDKDIDDETANTVHHNVRGWPIALSLVALSIKRGDLKSLHDELPNNTRLALYPLFETVIFSQYTQAEKDFITKLSILDSFPNDLVTAITGEQKRDIVQFLHSNQFLNYDAEEKRLFFHPIYRDFLREKLSAFSHTDTLYQKAGIWCRENGYIYDAINYFRYSHSYDELWKTLLSVKAMRHKKSEANFYIEQIDALPEDFRTAHPMTRIFRAVMLVNNMQTEEARAELEQLEAQIAMHPDINERDVLLGEACIVHGFLKIATVQIGFENDFKKASELMPQGSTRWGAQLQLIDIGPGISLGSKKSGALQQSLRCIRAGVPYMTKVLHGAGRGLDDLCESEALFLIGSFKESLRPAYHALYTARSSEQYDIAGSALFMLLRIYILLGDHQQIQRTLEQIDLCEAESSAANLSIWDIARAWMYCETDDIDKIARWIRQPERIISTPVNIDRALLIQQRYLIATRQYTESLALLKQVAYVGKKKNAIITLIYMYLARAVTYYYLGESTRAIRSLEKSFQLAKGDQLYTPFVEYGPRTRSLFSQAIESSNHSIPKDWLIEMNKKANTYAKRLSQLVQRLHQDKKTSAIRLSPRETELLTHISHGLTRDEIATRMHLSINTVKSTIKQVFSKLGAINAADAVRIAYLNKLI